MTSRATSSTATRTSSIPAASPSPRAGLPPAAGRDAGRAKRFAAVLDAHGVEARGAGPAERLRHRQLGEPRRDATRIRPLQGDRRGRSDDDRHGARGLAARGVVGVRFNLVSYDPDALAAAGAPRLLERLKALGLVRADLCATTRNGRRCCRAVGAAASGSWSIISASATSHAASRQPASRPCSRWARGHAPRSSSPRRSASRAGRALSTISTRSSRRCSRPSASSAASGARTGRSSTSPRRSAMPICSAPLARWLPDAADRERVLWHNPVRLFGFGDDGMTPLGTREALREGARCRSASPAPA